MTNETNTNERILELTASTAAAYLAHNSVNPTDVGDVIETIFAKLSGIVTPKVEAVADLIPAVPVKKSVTDEYIVCLEDGKKLKMLKRHLRTSYDMTPEEYRAKWGLGADYPMTAPAYARKRQELAKQIGLGRKAGDRPQHAPKAAEPKTPGKRPGRPAKAAEPKPEAASEV